MNTKSFMLRISKFAFVYIVVFFILLFSLQVPEKVTIKFEIQQENGTFIQVFQDIDGDFLEEKSETVNLISGLNSQNISIDYDINSSLIRFDFDNIVNEINITNLIFLINFKKYPYNLNDESIVHKNNLQVNENSEKLLTIRTIENDDPYIVMAVSDSLQEEIKKGLFNKKLIVVAISSILITVIAFVYLVKRRVFIEFIKAISQNKGLIFRLAKNDFKMRYAGSMIGFAWAIIQPIITILVFWFVFQVGLRVTSTDGDVPFAIWFIAGIIPWFFFSDTTSSASNSFSEYSFLVKKVIFNIQIVPLIKIFSNIVIHLLFVFVLIMIYLGYDFNLSIYNLQLIYYIFCNFILVISISYILSVFSVFLKDVGQIIGIILQIGMWVTPIMWSDKILSGAMVWLIKLNPMYYIVQGFRDSLFYKKWFYEDVNLMLYFWGFVALSFMIGTFVFRRTRKHFADVL